MEVVKVKASNLNNSTASVADKSLDLTNTADLALIKTQAITEMASVSGIKATAFNAMADDTATAIKNVNDKIEMITVTNLSFAGSKNIFSTTQVLADQVKAAATAEATSSGSGSIAFTSTTAVNMASTNKAPSSIALSENSISEGASSLIIGTLSTTDSDQTSGVAFKYTLAEIEGSDWNAFSIDQATGDLSLKVQPDYETKSSYNVTILVTDEGGKTYPDELSVIITKALSLTEVLDDVFTTSSLDFPITEFAFDLESEREPQQYATTASTYVANGVLFQDGTVTDTETLTTWQGDYRRR